ncbi:hypothetical protein CCH79_00016062 [Gambusia affinis]|uniref:small monomeric GTPase n=1 Tax=Gambusia affinis TaxID=33528 RepID=A0A315VAU3_GAMAF|nr:hypothetical protein CCH79_00016062 [Gambusia affinis]
MAPEIGCRPSSRSVTLTLAAKQLHTLLPLAPSDISFTSQVRSLSPGGADSTWEAAGESTYRHQANIDDEVVTMEILDTAGQEDIQQKEGHMRWGDGFIIVYDITDRGSFEEVAPLRTLLEEVKKPKNVPLVLVGNKSDLDHVRQVPTEEGERLAAEMACAFYECSACADEGGVVAEAFHELCREVRRRKAVQGKARRRSSTTHVKQAINKMLTKISS